MCWLIFVERRQAYIPSETEDITSLMTVSRAADRKREHMLRRICTLIYLWMVAWNENLLSGQYSTCHWRPQQPCVRSFEIANSPVAASEASSTFLLIKGTVECIDTYLFFVNIRDTYEKYDDTESATLEKNISFIAAALFYRNHPCENLIWLPFVYFLFFRLAHILLEINLRGRSLWTVTSVNVLASLQPRLCVVNLW